MAGGPPLFSTEITSLSFYFSSFQSSDEAAEYVIRNDQGPGTFLLRPSTRNPGSLTLTISIGHNHARHVNVQQRVDETGRNQTVFYIIPERFFPSFHDLYAYYSVNPISNLEMIDDVKLLSPLNRASAQPAAVRAQPAPPLVQPAPAPPVQPAPAPPVQPAPAPVQPVPPPTVRPDEIPPLPRKSSMSGVGPDAVSNDAGRRLSNSSQSGAPQPPPVDPGRPRLSLDLKSNDNWHKSMNGKELSPVSGRPGPGAVGGTEQGVPSYIAPGSPGFDVSNNATATLSKKELKKLHKLEQKQEKLKKKEEKKKKNKKAEMNDMVQLGWCRPPMPTPEREVQPCEDDPPYYSSPRPYKNHLEELKKMLRESEICDCGLRMIEAELVDGWTVHRSRENATFLRVFYQHEDGNTTWVFPVSIASRLSVEQVEFIVRLCADAQQELPPCILQRHQSIMQGGAGMRQLSSSSTSSSRSRTSSNPLDSFGSDLYLENQARLDQRPPMAGPGRRK